MVARLATITSPCARRAAGQSAPRRTTSSGLSVTATIGLGVVVDVDPPDVGLALVPVEPVDVELDRLVEVDRVLVDQRLGAEQVDLADDPRPVRGRVDDHDVLLAPRSAARSPTPGSSRSTSTSGRRPPGGRDPPRRGTRAGRRPRPGRRPRRARTAARTWRPSGGPAGRGGCPGRDGPPRASPSSRNSGWWIDVRSTGEPLAHEDPTLTPLRRPARPICCQVPATEPG